MSWFAGTYLAFALKTLLLNNSCGRICHPTPSQGYYLFLQFIYLKGRKREGRVRRENSSICCFTPLNALNSQEWGWGPEAKSQVFCLSLPHGRQEPKNMGHRCLLLSRCSFRKLDWKRRTVTEPKLLTTGHRRLRQQLCLPQQCPLQGCHLKPTAGVSMVAQVNPLPAASATHMSSSLSPSCSTSDSSWESSRRRPECLGPCTHEWDLTAVPGSFVLEQPRP